MIKDRGWKGQLYPSLTQNLPNLTQGAKHSMGEADNTL